MELTGIWKPYGQYVKKDQKITIQGHEITGMFCQECGLPMPKQ